MFLPFRVLYFCCDIHFFALRPFTQYDCDCDFFMELMACVGAGDVVAMSLCDHLLWIFPKYFHWIQWNICHYSKRARICHLLCKRLGCYHHASKTHARDRIFKLSPVHSSVIHQIPWIRWIVSSIVSVRKIAVAIASCEHTFTTKFPWKLRALTRVWGFWAGTILLAVRGKLSRNYPSKMVIETYCQKSVFLWIYENVSCVILVKYLSICLYIKTFCNS